MFREVFTLVYSNLHELEMLATVVILNFIYCAMINGQKLNSIARYIIENAFQEYML